MRLHHVQLAMPAGSEPICREFYCGTLGWTEIDKPPALAQRGGLWLEVGAHQVHLGVEADFRAAKKAHSAFTVADLDALAGRLTLAGARTTFDNAIPHTRRFYTEDPVGNRLEFIAEA